MDHILYPIEKKRITDHVLESITEMILSGDFKSGDRLPSDGEIASRLNVGRNSVREAMKVLQVLGVITRRQGDGTFLSDEESGSINLKPLLIPLVSQIKKPEDLVELRTLFENGTIDIVIEKATEKEIDFLKSKNKKFEEALTRTPPSVEEVIKADEEFHLSMAEVSGNRALITLERIIFNMYKPTIKSTSEDAFKNEKIKEGVMNHHRNILAAIEKRDKSAIRDITRRYLGKWKNHMKS